MRSKNDKSKIGRMTILDETPGNYCEWVKGRSFRIMRVFLRGVRAGMSRIADVRLNGQEALDKRTNINKSAGSW